MRILQVNDIDLPGRRFNGYDLQLMLNKKGYKTKQLVCNKMSQDENVLSFLPTQSDFFIRELCKRFEEKVSLQSAIYPYGELMKEMDAFKEADIVHYHLIFNHFMSMYSFRDLVQSKPTVWTLHDPWALTGHCVHPIDCNGWLTGCHNCKHLDRYSPLTRNSAHSIWEIKRQIYSQIDLDIVVASNWMLDLVKRSPLTSHFKNIHLIPFGIDTNIFKKKNNVEELRKKEGISKDSFVIMFRQDDQEWKGLPYIKEVLSKMKKLEKIVFITVGKTGLLDEYKDKFKIIEYSWISNPEEMVKLYSISDLFLMPSVAESFGLMAVEAMSCSLPVIVSEGTALPGITFAPDCGIELKKGDTKKFIGTILRLISSPEECTSRGKRGRKLVEKHYNIKRYNEDLINLYKEILKRNKSNSKRIK